MEWREVCRVWLVEVKGLSTDDLLEDLVAQTQENPWYVDDSHQICAETNHTACRSCTPLPEACLQKIQMESIHQFIEEKFNEL